MPRKKKEGSGQESCVTTMAPTGEYLEYVRYFQKGIATTKDKLIAAECKSAAARLEKNMESYINQSALGVMDENWMSVVDSLLANYCQHAIERQIKATPIVDRGKWTEDVLSKKIDACELNEAAREAIYKFAEGQRAMSAVRIAEAPQVEKSTEEILEDMVSYCVYIPPQFFGGGDLFGAIASEDYLRDADIHKDDLVVFHKEATAQYGQIVCALIDEKLAMRYYLYDDKKGTAYLRSANPEVQDVYDFYIVGTEAGVLRRHELSAGAGEVHV